MPLMTMKATEFRAEFGGQKYRIESHSRCEPIHSLRLGIDKFGSYENETNC
jgi:hypothetical protein